MMDNRYETIEVIGLDYVSVLKISNHCNDIRIKNWISSGSLVIEYSTLQLMYMTSIAEMCNSLSSNVRFFNRKKGVCI